MTKSTVSSSKASKKTLRRRTDELNQHRSVASAGSEVAQMHQELKSLTPDERRDLWEDMEFKIEIPALTGLALKADLCLPWNRMRAMKRSHFSLGVRIECTGNIGC